MKPTVLSSESRKLVDLVMRSRRWPWAIHTPSAQTFCASLVCSCNDCHDISIFHQSSSIVRPSLFLSLCLLITVRCGCYLSLFSNRTTLTSRQRSTFHAIKLEDLLVLAGRPRYLDGLTQCSLALTAARAINCRSHNLVCDY